MEDSQPTKSDAAAVRRRRSSILKSQKATRTPFSELEFHIATPTDVTKSRRVSFSKRTGVAEFATNEATTTWKNFYEEHNKSLESSGNDSVAAANRRSVGHLGRRSYFDKQFQDDEGLVVDTINPRESNINLSFNTTNFADQIASLENTGDAKNLSAPHNQFNLSSFTEHQTKLFEDNLTNPGSGEVTDKIDLNFSINPIKINEKDDLDEIQRDLQMQQAASNVICHGPFRDRKSDSEYIEIDELNMTRAAVNIEQSDMSITDTIHSPKVQNVSKNTSLKNISASKKTLNSDWVADKENIVVNPYVAPRESVNFAVNEESDQVLVFDGKRLTVQSQNEPLITNEPQVTEKKALQRKTIVINLHDDLPNLVDDVSMSRQLANKFENSDSKIDMSISFTQALPAKVMLPEENKRRTIVFDDGDISVTQGILAKVILPTENKNKRQTIVFDDLAGDISITQAVQGNVLSEIVANSVTNNKNTVIYEDDANISMTQVLPSKVIDTQKRKTIIYDYNEGNISLTQIVKSSKILEQSKPLEKEYLHDDNDQDISMTQAVDNVILTQSSFKRATSLFDNETNDISMTQALPSNVLLSMQENNCATDTVESIFKEEDNNLSINEVVPSKFPEQSLVNNFSTYFDNFEDISITQALPVAILEKKEAKRNTIVFDDNDMANVSVTQAVPTKIITDKAQSLDVKQGEQITAKRKTIVFDDADISVTQALPANVICNIINDTKHNDCDYENIKLSNTQDVLDEINSIIDPNDKSLVNCYQDLEPRNDKTQSDNVHNSLFDRDVLAYPAFFKFGKRHRKKSPVPEYSEETNTKTIDEGGTSSDVKPAQEPSNNKTVLNELLNMSNASIVIDNDKNTTIPVKTETFVKQEESLGQSQFQIGVNLEDTKVVQETNEHYQSEFQIDIPLEGKQSKESNVTDRLLTDVTSDTETDYKSTEENIDEVNNQAEIQLALSDQNTATVVVSEVDLQPQQLALEYKSHNEDKIEPELEKISESNDHLEPDIENSIVEQVNNEPVKLNKYENVLEYKPEVVEVDLKKESFTIEHKIESDPDISIASRRLSRIQSRQSLALTRDAFLNDITLAQQILQTTKFELENTSSIDDATQCTLDEEDDANPTNRESPVVVKKLHFEDETFSDSSEPNVSTLKKVSFPEPAEVIENKAMVIPPFLKNVSEEVKDLMRDLVKPLPEMPFEINSDPLKKTSTCSMQVQASLITSSQIEVTSNESFNDENLPSPGRTKYVSFANQQESDSISSKSQSNDDVPLVPLVFDPHNPLNNVAIAPFGMSEVHSYNPLVSDENLLENKNNVAINLNPAPIIDNLVLINNPPSPKMINSEVNTAVTVKEDKELLRIHSSLTVMNDSSSPNSNSENPENTDSEHSLHREAPYTEVRETESSLTNEKLSANTSLHSETDSNNSLLSIAPAKAKKRSYSPNKSENHVTPKPSSKIMRTSTSPTITLVDGSLTSVEFDLEFEGVWSNNSNQAVDSHSPRSKREKDAKKRNYSPKKTNNTTNHEATPKPASKLHKSDKSRAKKSENIGQEKNSRNIKLSPDNTKIGTKVTVQRALISYDKPKKTTKSPKKNIEDCQAGVNMGTTISGKVIHSAIISKIDKFPFMGDGVCKWEECTRNKWVFSMLKGYVRLTVNFARTKKNLVTDDTPIDNVTIHVNKEDTGDVIKTLCAEFAAETMRSIVARKKHCTTAVTLTGRLGQLLGRCAGVARLSAQWARAMFDAKMRLGFTLTSDGKLSFRVANFPLHSHYQLSMCIRLEHSGTVPWPRACDVTVTAVVGDDVTAEATRLAAAIAEGWGHVPVTVWTLFRHLKNKKPTNSWD